MGCRVPLGQHHGSDPVQQLRRVLRIAERGRQPMVGDRLHRRRLCTAPLQRRRILERGGSAVRALRPRRPGGRSSHLRRVASAGGDLRPHPTGPGGRRGRLHRRGGQRGAARGNPHAVCRDCRGSPGPVGHSRRTGGCRPGRSRGAGVGEHRWQAHPSDQRCPVRRRRRQRRCRPGGASGPCRLRRLHHALHRHRPGQPDHLVPLRWLLVPAATIGGDRLGEHHPYARRGGW